MLIKFNKHLLPDKSKPIMVCCSAGADSTAAALFLKQGGYNVFLYHFNHKLRPQNDLMEQKVRDFAKYFRFPLAVANASDFPIDLTKGLEAGARGSRLKAYEFFVKNANTNILVQAQHLDDAIESYLMNTFQGKKNGLPLSPITDFGPFKVVRPFILTKKADFEKFIKQHAALEQFVVEDETNTDIKYSRNYVRHVVIPTVKERYGLDKVVRKLYINNEVFKTTIKW
jgi:tRNA(Ile)-lysidine synthase